MRFAVLFGALIFALLASPASAQPLPAPGAKVWTDADLLKPMPRKAAKAEELEGLKLRAEIPNLGSYLMGGGGSSDPAPQRPGNAYYAPHPRPEPQRDINDHSGQHYNALPVYPFYAYPVIYQQQPVRRYQGRPYAAPRPGVRR